MIIAGTGHRPKYCPCKYKDNHPWLINLKKRLSNYLIEIRDHHDDDIIRAGGAIGWDTWLAQVALELDFTLHLFLPFPDQGKNWPSSSRNEYERIKSEAHMINFTADEYYPDVFLDRDVQMITGSDTVVSLLNPEVDSGGTYYTVQEAKKLEIPVTNFWRN